MPASRNLLIALNTMIRVISRFLNKWCADWFAVANDELLTDYSAREQLEAIESNLYENMAQAVSNELKASILTSARTFLDGNKKYVLRQDSTAIDESLRRNKLCSINHRESCSSIRLTTCHRQKDSGCVFGVFNQPITSCIACLSYLVAFTTFPLAQLLRRPFHRLPTVHTSFPIGLASDCFHPTHFYSNRLCRLMAQSRAIPPVEEAI